MKARLDKRLTTVPAGWRVAAGDFLARLDIAREMGMFEPKPPHIMSTFRRRFSDPPVLYVVTKTAPGSTLRYLSLNPAALPFFIEQETLLKMQHGLRTATVSICERCGAPDAKPRLLHNWQNRCDLHNTKGAHREVPDPEV